MKHKEKRILIRGGGDLASGVAAVLHRKGWQVVISELSQPLVVRRKVAFAEAIWEGQCCVEEIVGQRVASLEELETVLYQGKVAVMIDPELQHLYKLQVQAIVDARMTKLFSRAYDYGNLPIIGLGPGFIAGVNCDAVVETNRGEKLGSVIWEGSAQANTGVPGIVQGYGLERVLYAPVSGKLVSFSGIGDFVKKGQIIAMVGEVKIFSPFDGMLRGLARDGLSVKKGTKVGDVDPRFDPNLCTMISDKALLIGEGVLVALERLIKSENHA